MQFLRARWHDLLLVSYAVPDTWLRPYLPPGLTLDRWVGGRPQTISWRAGGPAVLPPAGGVEDHFKEHEWGFGRLPDGCPARYQVEHPRWRVYPLAWWRLDVDFAALYGPPWGRLNDRE